MRKKLMLLSVTLAICAMPASVFTSCSKDDDERGPEANLKSVDGTEWIASRATMTFRNGKYTINCTVPGGGTYVQDGNHLTFDGNLIVINGGGVRPTVGTISKYGDSMKVTFASTSGSTENITFTYNILAN